MMDSLQESSKKTNSTALGKSPTEVALIGNIVANGSRGSFMGKVRDKCDR